MKSRPMNDSIPYSLSSIDEMLGVPCLGLIIVGAPPLKID
jgi:hypothetical protein